MHRYGQHNRDMDQAVDKLAFNLCRYLTGEDDRLHSTVASGKVFAVVYSLTGSAGQAIPAWLSL